MQKREEKLILIHFYILYSQSQKTFRFIIHTNLSNAEIMHGTRTRKILTSILSLNGDLEKNKRTKMGSIRIQIRI